MAALSAGHVQDASRFPPQRHGQPFGRAAVGSLVKWAPPTLIKQLGAIWREWWAMSTLRTIVQRASAMTELLERAITAIKRLSPEAQDAIASRLLSEVDDEKSWDLRFATTTDTQWDRLADKVRLSIATGKTTPLDDVFPPQKSS